MIPPVLIWFPVLTCFFGFFCRKHLKMVAIKLHFHENYYGLSQLNKISLAQLCDSSLIVIVEIHTCSQQTAFINSVIKYT